MFYNITILLILLFLSAFFSGSETSLFSLSKIRVRRLKVENAKNSQVVDSLLKRPTDLLITILIGNMFANVFASSMAASFSIKMWGETGIGLSVVIMTIIVVIFCEIMPKIIAIRNSSKLSLLASPFILLFSRLVLPLRWSLFKLTDGLLSFFEGKLKKVEADITKDELESAIKVGYAKGGILDKEEAEMMKDVLQLSDKKVEDVMTHNENMVSFPISMSVKEMSVAIREAELSRVPVYERKRANILGILYAKDLLKRKLEQAEGVNVRDLLRTPFYVTKKMRLSQLLREFRIKKTHLALVNDEKGKLSGLVTLEDLLEEIIGDIRDKEVLVQRIQKMIEAILRPEAQETSAGTDEKRALNLNNA